MKKCRFWVLDQKKCGIKKDSCGVVFSKKCQIFTVFQLVSKNSFEKKGKNIWMGKKYDYLCSRLKSQIQ
ncbi:MAG TPA: hypothetical protein PKA12_16210 [Saprospiraceae bacterium]|nr:hypothetical protein [Saprospiraceae bacterium]